MEQRALDADEVAGRGWLRVAGYLDPGACDRLAKPSHFEWQRAAPRLGKVRQDGWFAQVVVDEAPSDVRALARGIHAAFGSRAPSFNEVTWQRYEPGAGHIDAHRDQPHYTGVIAILTLSGRAPFSILARREPREQVEAWQTGPGDLVVLRGAGFGAPEARCPFHQVGVPDGTRTTLSFRHDVRPYGGWRAREAGVATGGQEPTGGPEPPGAP